MRALLLALLLCPAAAPAAVPDCPAKAAPGAAAAETAEDCPWAGVARLLDEKADRHEALEPVFAAYAPGLLRQLDADRPTPVLRLWGESINFDELARGTIVEPGVLSFLASRLGAPQPRGRYAHAGMEHTYGYLFSLLPTKFGFKRARWVRPDIEQGLGLPRGLLGPAPAEGTLLANVTCVAGGIALKDDPAASGLLARMLPYCGAAARAYASRPVKRSRLTEEVSLAGGRKVALRTELVPFKAPAGGNTHLLVYSVYDSALKRAYLVTAFPVNSGFVKSVLAPGGLGPGKPVQTRYNAYVEGLTEAGGVKGERKVSVAGR